MAENFTVENLRTRVFQWITDRYPTRFLHNSKILKTIYRLLLDTIRPRGRIVIATKDYRFRYQRVPKKNLTWQTALKRPYEAFETEVFRSLIKPGMNILDVGANFGHYAMVAAPLVGAGGRVFAFEPVPDLFDDFTFNLGLNSFSNVTPIMKVVGAQPGTVELFLDRENSGGHSLGKDNLDTLQDAIQVAMVTIDDFVAQNLEGREVGLLKMDTQGGEGAIIAGATETLRKHKPAVLMEFWPFGMKTLGYEAEDTLKILSDLGYRFQLVDDKQDQLRDSTISQLLAAFPSGNKDTFGNILAVHGR